MILCVLNCQKTLAAELPQALKPAAPESFWCTDRSGAEQVAIAFRENRSAQSQIKGSDIDWVLVGEGIALGFLVGIVVDKTLLK